MAVAGAVKLEVIARAQENIRAVLKQSNAAIKQTSDELKKAGVAQTKLGAAVAKSIRGQSRYRATLIRTADGVSNLRKKFMNAKAAVGVFMGALALRALKDFIVEGEKAANIAIRFAQAIPNATVALGELKKATGGLVTETDLQIIANRFKRLGVPIKQTTRLLELATKAAHDQGREVIDVARVIESSLKGRTTGLIDIGVNLDKITGLTKKYAKENNIAAGSVDEMTRRLEIALPAALEALGEQFDDVPLEQFQTDMQRASTSFDDFISDMQSAASGEFLTAMEFMRGIVGKTTEEMADDWVGLKDKVDGIDFTLTGVVLRKGEGPKRAAKALDELRKRLASLRPEEKIAAWQAYSSQIDTITAKNYEQIRSLFELESAYKAVERARDAAEAPSPVQRFGEGAPTGGATGMVTAEQTRLQMAAEDKAAASKAKIDEADKARRSARIRAAKKAREAAQASTEKGIAAAKREIEILKSVDALDKARIKNRHAIAKAETAKVAAIAKGVKKATATDLEAVQKQKARLVLKKEIDAVEAALTKKSEEKAQAEADAITLAKNALGLAEAKTDTQRIDLELLQREREIRESSLSVEEAGLSIDLARLEAQKAKAEVAQAERAAFAQTLGEGIGGAFSGGAAILGQLDADLARLNRPARYKNIIAGFNSMSVTVPKATEKFAALGDASLTSGQKVAGGMAAGLSVVGPATAAFVESARDKALVMAAFEAAMAVATAWVNPAESIGHLVASTMFFAMAGVAAAQPTSARPEEETAGGGSLVTPAVQQEEQVAQRIQINFGPGMLLGLPQELGRAISDQVNSLAGTGMESTAF